MLRRPVLLCQGFPIFPGFLPGKLLATRPVGSSSNLSRRLIQSWLRECERRSKALGLWPCHLQMKKSMPGIAGCDRCLHHLDCAIVA